ncbi:MAG: terpene cyclase/mutase family protein [Fimbriiglobus sp.]|jgi:hypothetical protein|nr:terpene cyclase/mutase family protein [Fimbriiglobus sp.]
MSQRDPDNRPEKKPPVIELHSNHGLTPGEAFLRRLLPAAVVSAGVHLLLAVTAFLISVLMPTADAAQERQRVDVAVEQQTDAPPDANLTETMPSIDDPGVVTVADAPVMDVTVQTEVVSNEPAGTPDGQVKEKLDSLNTAGSPSDLLDIGAKVEGPGAGTIGSGAEGLSMSNQSMRGRSKSTRDALLRTGGGNTESEAAVARGLAWLARMQKKDGSWTFDGTNAGERAAATGIALLPFLAAGQTHKPGKDNKYKDTVTAAIGALLKMQKSDGSFTGNNYNVYANAIAAVALCEAFGMTGDKSLLLRPCQAAVDFIQKSQGKNGSWGYKVGDEGDTSIVGWQVQALHSAKMCKELKVDPKVLERAMKFLDSVASKPKNSSIACTFGYSSPGARPSLTAVGLLCRYYLNGWGPNSPGMRDGVDYLLKEYPADPKETFDMYYYYYATQVLHFREGEEWHKQWNPKMRDMLVGKQVKDPNKPAVDGSWDPDGGQWIGPHCGRLGTTALCLLTLEVYYRHLPLYNRGTGGKDILDGK